MTTREWEVFTISGGGPQSLFASDLLGRQSHVTMCPFNLGETILRVRVQGSLSYELRDTNPTMQQMDTIMVASENWTWGVWADKTGSSIPGQTPPINGTLRDEFIFWNQMTLHHVDEFHDQLGVDRWIATWTFPTNNNDSTSSRGPCTVASTVELCWGFNNPVYELMSNVTPGVTGFFGYALTWEVLKEIP